MIRRVLKSKYVVPSSNKHDINLFSCTKIFCLQIIISAQILGG